MPGLVRIMSHSFETEFVPKLRLDDNNEQAGNGVAAYGMYDGLALKFTFEANMAADRERQTFVHENLHAMLDLAGLDDTLGAQAPGLDEHVVTTLAPLILTWLRENPGMHAYLTEVVA
jgi:hypothetical protein